MELFEVFSPRDGVAIVRVRSGKLARIIARLIGADYAKIGEGWINE